MATEKKETLIIIGPVRLSYAKIWEPGSFENDTSGKKKYGAALLFPKSDTATKKKVEDAIAIAKAEGVKKGLFDAKAKIEMPLKDGDDKGEKNPEYAGHWYLNAKSDRRPGVVDKNNEEIIDKEEIYSGVYVKSQISFYPFNKIAKGVGVSLENIKKVKDGEPLSGGMSAQDAFADDVDMGEEIDETDDLLG